VQAATGISQEFKQVGSILAHATGAENVINEFLNAGFNP
jgi:hypothetical protein